MLQALRRIFLVLTIVMLCGINYIQSIAVDSTEWKSYKLKFGKSYPLSEEASARYNFAYNSKLIRKHNDYAKAGRYTYTLAVNQFSDMRLSSFNALFPQTTQPNMIGSASVLPEPEGLIPSAFSPRNVIQDFMPSVRDQGTTCSSGWAYATATSIQLRDNLNGLETPELSAQELIDCSTVGTDGCVGEVPQTAFNYLIGDGDFDGMPLYKESDYPDENTSPTSQSCRIKLNAVDTYTLTQYSYIPDGEEEKLRSLVSNNYPVVVEFNPTSFEFMHYAGGIFKQPATKKGSHYMLVVGYDAESWILQNSFGITWGEGLLPEVEKSTGGFMRLKRNDVKARMPKSATLPIN